MASYKLVHVVKFEFAFEFLILLYHVNCSYQINLTSEWTLEEFKAAILNAGVLGSISEQTLKVSIFLLIFLEVVDINYLVWLRSLLYVNVAVCI